MLPPPSNFVRLGAGVSSAEEVLAIGLSANVRDVGYAYFRYASASQTSQAYRARVVGGEAAYGRCRE